MRSRLRRVGLLQGGTGSFGGQPMAASRLAGMLSGLVEPVSVWLERADGGPAEVVPYARGGSQGWRLRCPTRDEVAALQWMAGQLTRLARRERLDLLHLHGVFEFPLAAAATAGLLGLPLVVSYRGSDLNLGLFHQAATLEALFQAATVSTVMNPTMERMARRFFRPRGPVLWIPNHVDPGRFNPEPVHLQLPRPVVGCVAEFRRITGIDLLLAAFARLQARRPLSLLLVGPWSAVEAPYYTKVMDHLPGRERVHRTGFVPHARVLGLMAACDALVFPSIAEGMANKVLEAMAAGTPVVASRVPGNRELVEDGVDGRLFEPRDAADLERVLEDVLERPEVHREMAARAREKVLREFTWERERAGWVSCYRAAGVPL